MISEENRKASRLAYRPAEVARLTGVSLSLIRLEIARGALRAGRVGRRGVVITPAAVRDWLEGRERGPAAAAAGGGR